MFDLYPNPGVVRSSKRVQTTKTHTCTALFHHVLRTHLPRARFTNNHVRVVHNLPNLVLVLLYAAADFSNHHASLLLSAAVKGVCASSTPINLAEKASKPRTDRPTVRPDLDRLRLNTPSYITHHITANIRSTSCTWGTPTNWASQNECDPVKWGSCCFLLATLSVLFELVVVPDLSSVIARSRAVIGRDLVVGQLKRYSYLQLPQLDRETHSGRDRQSA